MWRRWGDYLYAVLVLAVFVVEALALAALTVTFLGRVAGFVPYQGLFKVLVGVLVVTAATLLVTTTHVLVYTAVSTVRDRTIAERVAYFTGLFGLWAQDRNVAIPRKLSRDAETALLDLRELLAGDEGNALAELIVQSGLAGRLVARSRSHRLGPRMQAIEGLAKARLPETLDAAFDLFSARSPLVVRAMAARVVARTLAVMHNAGALRRSGHRFVEALLATPLPIGVVEEALVLLDPEASEVVVRELLLRDEVPPKILRAAIDAAGRSGLRDLGPRLTALAGDRDPEVRAHALQAALALRVDAATPGLAGAIRDGTAHDADYVRLHAVRALELLPSPEALERLPQHLGDTSWFVRRAAAETLMGLGPAGAKTLEDLRSTHYDHYARTMARAVLTTRTLQEAT